MTASVSVEAKLATLPSMSSAELKEEWCRLTGTPLPRISPSLIRLAVAWEIQARAYGGLSRSTTQQLDQLARGLTRTSAARSGMRLVREWQGKVHVVTVGENGRDDVIRWDDREWRSLSEVARAITGTRWSGPAFFGLKKRWRHEAGQPPAGALRDLHPQVVGRGAGAELQLTRRPARGLCSLHP